MMGGGAVTCPAATPESDMKQGRRPVSYHLYPPSGRHPFRPFRPFQVGEFAEVRSSEKPGAVVPHAGICARAVG
jgi:hypothetical protein